MPPQSLPHVPRGCCPEEGYRGRALSTPGVLCPPGEQTLHPTETREVAGCLGVPPPALPLGRSLTRVCSEVASERVPPAAGVVAEGAFEGLLPGVQLDVTQQVPLLGEGGSALVAVEGPFA